MVDARPTRLLLLLALLNASAASSLYLAILPGIVRSLDLTETQGGLLVTCSALAFGLAAPWWGRRSESAGRVRIIAVGLVGYALASAAFAAAMTAGAAGVVTGGALFALLLTSRPLGGALAGAVPATAQAYVADTSTAEQRTGALAIVGIANGLGMIVGPAVGGGLAAFGLTTPLWTAAVVALVVAVAVSRGLPEPIRHTTDTDGPAAAPLSVRDPRPRPLLLMLLGLFTAVALLSTTMGFLLQDRLELGEQAASTGTGMVLTAVGVGLIAVQILVVQRLRPGPAVLLRGGIPVAAAGVVVLLIAPNLAVFVASGLLMGAGVGLAMSGAIAAATLRVGAHDQGMLGGLTVGAQVAGFIIGPTIGGALYQQAPTLPGIAAIVLFGGAFAWALAGRPVSTPAVEEAAATGS